MWIRFQILLLIKSATTDLQILLGFIFSLHASTVSAHNPILSLLKLGMLTLNLIRIQLFTLMRIPTLAVTAVGHHDNNKRRDGLYVFCSRCSLFCGILL
jgi:hypothetical protein